MSGLLDRVIVGGKLLALAVLLALVLSMQAGCASRKPLEAWQESVEQYVTEPGGGDPAALRELPALRSPRTPRPARIEIGATNVPGARGRMCDVQGVLAGIVSVGGHTWYVFIVGVIELDQSKARRVSDVRVAGLCAEGESMHWRFGPRDRYALRHYLNTRRESPFEASAFPGVTDVFSVEVGRRLVMVHEKNSGSMWVVDLVDDDGPRDLNPFN